MSPALPCNGNVPIHIHMLVKVSVSISENYWHCQKASDALLQHFDESKQTNCDNNMRVNAISKQTQESTKCLGFSKI